MKASALRRYLRTKRATRLLVEGYEDKNTVIKVKEEHYA